MSTGTLAILIIVGFALSLIIGNKFKTNIGVLAYCFAFLIGAISGQMTLSKVINLFPLNTFFLLMAITLFYGYATENGTLKWIADSMVYACRKIGWFIPLAIWLIGFILSATGSGALASAAVLAPMAIAVAKSAGIPYFPTLVAVYTSTIAGGNSPIAQQGSTMRGYIEDWGTEGLATVAPNIITYILLSGILCALIYYIPFYFIFKCYKTKAADIPQPAPINHKQKITLFLIVLSVIIMIIPASIANATGDAFWKTLSGWCDVKLVMLVFAAIATLLRLADEKTVIVHRVPWNTLIMLAGVGTLIALAKEVGVVDLFAVWISTSVPLSLIAPALAIAGGILSLFSGALSVVCPLFFPMVPALAAQTGLNPALLYAAIYTGASSTGVSPLSTGGALILANLVSDPEYAPNEDHYFKSQFIVAFIYMAIVAVIFFLKVPDLFGNFSMYL